MNPIKEFRSLFKGEFGKNFLTLLTGTSISQVIPILISPILTRLFTPEEFGLLALFTSTSLFMGNIATMQYDSAIMLPEKDKDAINIMALAMLSVTGFTLITIIIVIFFNGGLCRLMGNEKISNWLFMVPLSVFLTGLFRILNIWASRNKQFKRLAMRNIMQSTTNSGTKLGIGTFTEINGGLIIGSLIGQFTATTVLLFQTIIKDKISFSSISFRCMALNATKYKEFPIYANLQGFLSMFKETGTRYIISKFYGDKVLGGYSFTLGLLQKPSQLIGSAISQVYYQKASDTYKASGDLWALTKNIMFRLLVISVILYLPIFIFGQEIFSFIFGENWKEAGIYAQIMAPWLMCSLLIQFSTRIPQIVNKQKEFFKIVTFFNLLFFLVVLVLSVLKVSFHITLVFMTFTMVTMITFWFFWFRIITNKGTKE